LVTLSGTAVPKKAVFDQLISHQVFMTGTSLAHSYLSKESDTNSRGLMSA